MFFYNQRDYAHIDYSKPDGSYATVKSGGCGVCSALMVLNNLYGKEVMSVAAMAQFAKNCGARGYDGTDMATLLAALSKKYTITYKTTSLNKELLAHLKAGGMAVINQGTAYNVFSTAGHFVVAHSIVSGTTIRCLDPDLYAGKYAAYSRPERIVKQSGNEVWVSLTQIGLATDDRNPNYYLVSYTGKRHEPVLKKGQTVTLKKGAKLYRNNSSQSGVMCFKDFTNFTSDAQALLKVGAKLEVKEVSKKANGNIWIKTKYGGWICVYDYKNDISKL
ncbi:MAG: hypothetical protein IKE65_02730 [Clostridia bacterium]|nr:hypothetical protein [Clostridia bacterium]